MLEAVKSQKPYLGAVLGQKARPVEVRHGYVKVFLSGTGMKEPHELAKELEAALSQAYEEKWTVELASAGGGETDLEREKRLKDEALEKAKLAPQVRAIMHHFPGARVIDVLPENDNQTPTDEDERG